MEEVGFCSCETDRSPVCNPEEHHTLCILTLSLRLFCLLQRKPSLLVSCSSFLVPARERHPVVVRTSSEHLEGISSGLVQCSL